MTGSREQEAARTELARRIFLDASELPESEQARLLEDVCAGDALLRGEVERYLVAHRATGGVLDRGVDELLLGLDTFDATEADASGSGGDSARHTSPAAGERIGPYRLLEIIGEGGMGTVWLAEQVTPVRRRVALKFIKPGMDTGHVVARFESERQALAVMDHPSIAKVLDAGATPTGQPYFAMEYFRGVNINEYCDAQRLSIRERVWLFHQVCSAIQHAHQKGVVHRDLKPGNVLVTVTEGGGALAKVIDFGVAKAVGGSLTDLMSITSTGQMLGTPAYMSPEQAEVGSVDVDTRTDVYALGIMLYELLAGKVPLDPGEVGAPAFLAHLIDRDGAATSPWGRVLMLEEHQQQTLAELRATDAKALKKDLLGDLQWIVLKAIEKDRDRRYDTANGLASDLKRYLSDEPILARPPTSAYRTRKFVRRHRLGVAFAATVALGLVGLTASMTVRAREIAQARDESALLAADSYVKTLSSLSAIYTSEVVNRLPNDVRISHDYPFQDFSVPLPQTLMALLAERMDDSAEGFEFRLYSEYPFPWRGPAFMDDFERRAFEVLRAYPDSTYSEFQKTEAGRTLRFARGDPMRPQCISCHNTHPDSPKTDWRAGELRGVLAVSLPLGSTARPRYELLLLVPLLGLLAKMVRNVAPRRRATAERHVS